MGKTTNNFFTFLHWAFALFKFKSKLHTMFFNVNYQNYHSDLAMERRQEDDIK